MMENHLKRVLNLIKKTGDTMVVVDKEGEDSFVVMDLDQYEMLLDSQMEYEDNVGDAIEDFRESEDPQDSQTPPNASDSNIWDVMQEAGEEGETWDIDQLSEEEYKDLEKQYELFANKHVEEVIQETQNPIEKKETQKNEQVKKDDEYGEEQFYLEPIE
jgi:PHD/YefM family antitoxin component YafN of YafNO toxin-antitoxin module